MTQRITELRAKLAHDKLVAHWGIIVLSVILFGLSLVLTGYIHPVVLRIIEGFADVALDRGIA